MSAVLLLKANQMVDYHILGSLAIAITLKLDAQNTGQLFCAGVYA